MRKNEFEVSPIRKNRVKKNLKESVLREGVLDASDDDGWMAKSQLYSLAKSSIELHRMINDSDDLEPWIISKIAQSHAAISNIKNHIDYAAQKLSGGPVQPDADLNLNQSVGNYEKTLLDDTSEMDVADPMSSFDGPYTTKSGQDIYYDPAEGMYWDPIKNRHISYSEWVTLNRSPIGEAKGKRVKESGSSGGTSSGGIATSTKPTGKVVKRNPGQPGKNALDQTANLFNSKKS